MIVYATYTQNGVKKKATLNETKYNLLANDPKVSNLTTYPTARLMEQAFGGSSNKRILLG